VSSQRDSERADLRLEERELRGDPEGELRELARIYEKRGLPPELAQQVAAALTERDALAAHARDEFGLQEERRARPLQASWASALAFSAGAVLPVIAVAVTPAAVYSRSNATATRRRTSTLLSWVSGSQRVCWGTECGRTRQAGLAAQTVAPLHQQRQFRCQDGDCRFPGRRLHPYGSWLAVRLELHVANCRAAVAAFVSSALPRYGHAARRRGRAGRRVVATARWRG
jgi:hypothetical protein